MLIHAQLTNALPCSLEHCPKTCACDIALLFQQTYRRRLLSQSSLLPLCWWGVLELTSVLSQQSGGDVLSFTISQPALMSSNMRYCCNGWHLLSSKWLSYAPHLIRITACFDERKPFTTNLQMLMPLLPASHFSTLLTLLMLLTCPTKRLLSMEFKILFQH